MTEAAVGGLVADRHRLHRGRQRVDQGRTATLDVDPGETSSCTFTNKKDATVTIVKDAVPDDPQDFAFTTTGAGPPASRSTTTPTRRCRTSKTFTVSGGGLRRQDGDRGRGRRLVADRHRPAPGTTTPPTGRTATLDVDPGETIVCTFTNTKDATVTIVKDAVPNDPQDFAFTTSGLGCRLHLDDDADATLPNNKTFTVSGHGLRHQDGDRGRAGGLVADRHRLHRGRRRPR